MKFGNHASPLMSRILTEEEDRKKLTDEDEVIWKESNVAVARRE